MKERIRWTNVMIGGEVWRVSLDGDVLRLLERLGAKAARNKSGATTLCGGLLRVTAKRRGM